MKLSYEHILEKLKASLWFIPLMMTLLGPIFALLLFSLDSYLSDKENFLEWMWTGGPEAYTDLLTTLASSLVTMATLLFSITMLVLTVVSQQYGSHILRVFKRSSFIKFVLGWFISSFVYTLFVIVFSTTRDDPDFHPQLSIIFGIVVMVFSFVIFIVFIHRMTNLIQSDHIIATVTNALKKRIDELKVYAEKPTELSIEVLQKWVEEGGIYLKSSGYIQRIDIPYLINLGKKYQTTFYLPFRPGHFVAKGVSVAYMPRVIEEKDFFDKVCESFTMGSERLPMSDFECQLEQLMEMCLKALSPGVNNTYIALTVIDHLGDVFVMLAVRRFPQELYHDEEGMLRVISKRFTYESFIGAAINPIKQNARSNPMVLIRLLDMLERVLGVTDDEEKKAILLEHADYVYRAGKDGIKDEEDVAALKKRYDSIIKVFG